MYCFVKSADRIDNLHVKMDEVILRTGFAGVTHAINFDPQKVKNGKALAVSHVQRVEELGGLGDSRLLRCSIVRTTTVGEHPYKVQLEVSFDFSH